MLIKTVRAVPCRAEPSSVGHAERAREIAVRSAAGGSFVAASTRISFISSCAC